MMLAVVEVIFMWSLCVVWRESC